MLFPKLRNVIHHKQHIHSSFMRQNQIRTVTTSRIVHSYFAPQSPFLSNARSFHMMGGGGGGGGAFVASVAKGGALAVGFVAVALGVLYKMQNKMLYIPEIEEGVPRSNSANPSGYRNPSEHKLPFENHMISTEDGVEIHSWLLLHPDSKAKRLPTIIFFHGNAGNIGFRLPQAAQMYHRLNTNILMVDYRSYGDSSGSKPPTEKGLRRDAEATLRFLQSHPSIDPTRLFILGQSLGGAVGFHLASYAEQTTPTATTTHGGDDGVEPPPVAGLIVENTFVSISRMVDELLPALTPVKPYLLRIGWDSAALAGRLKVPVLYLSGGSDELVPPEQMRELYDLSVTSSVCALFYVVEDGTHNETWLQGGDGYWNEIQQFINDALAITGKHSDYDATATGNKNKRQQKE